MASDDFLFKYLYAINVSKKNVLLDKSSEEYKRFAKDYSVFRSGRYLVDRSTIFIVNEVNSKRNVTPERHFIFLLNSLRKEKRYNRWPKGAASKDKDVEMLSIHYEVSLKKAREYLATHTEDQLRQIRETISPAGG